MIEQSEDYEGSMNEDASPMEWLVDLSDSDFSLGFWVDEEDPKCPRS